MPSTETIINLSGEILQLQRLLQALGSVALSDAPVPLCRTPFDAVANLCLNLDLRDALERAQVATSAARYVVADTECLTSCYRNPEEEQIGSSKYQGDPSWPEETGPWIPVRSAKEGKDGHGVGTDDHDRGSPSDFGEGLGEKDQRIDLRVLKMLRGALALVSGIGNWGRECNSGTSSDWLTAQRSSTSTGTSTVMERTSFSNSWRGHNPSAPPLSHGSNQDDVQSIMEAEPLQWMPDSSAFACMQCAAIFRPITCGRHHCRYCGGLFCRRCTSGRCLLPVKFRERDPQRTCDTCFEKLEPIQRNLTNQVSNAAQVATHDVTDLSCMRGWLNNPVGLSMEQEIYKATNTIRSYYKVGTVKPERSIPDTILKGAKGLAILTVIKVGMMVTYKLGTGLVVARRADGSWSAPSAVASCGVGWGPQAGGELTDFIIILNTTKAVKAFGGQVHFSVGAGMSAAAGPVGRAAEADVRAGDGGAAACFTYSCSKGAFIGVSLEYNMVATRSDTNLNFYGDAYLKARDILLGPVPQPRAAAPLYSALHDLFGKVDSPIE